MRLGATSRRSSCRSVVPSLVVISVFAATMVVGEGTAWAGRRPNVVVIMTDDQRFDTLQAMPNVRRKIRDRGVVFRNAFVPNSLCCPSRVSTLTGLYSHTTGVYGNEGPHGGFTAFDDRTSIATVLHDAGYRTGLVGKYLNGYIGQDFDNYDYVPPGWDRWFAFPTGSYYGYPVAADGKKIGPYGSAPGSYSARVMTKESRAFVDSTPRGVPFFLFYSAAAPHADPHPIDGEKTAIPAPRDVDRYAQIPAWRPATFGNRDDVSDMPAYIQQRNWSRRVSYRVDLVRQRQLESLTSLDRQVGRLVEALPGNTMVIFMSDNGDMWGEHRWKTKKVPYEESIRIPMIVSWPGHLPSGVDRRLALNVDVVPTILAAAGIDPGTPTGRVGSSGAPASAEGLDLLGGVRREAFVLEHATESGVVESVPPYCGVRTDDGWMYARYSGAGSPDGGFEDLFDVDADPLQQHNLARRQAFESDRLRMRALARTLCDPTPPGYDWRV